MKNFSFANCSFPSLVVFVGLLCATISAGASVGSEELAPVIKISTGSVQGVKRSFTPPAATGGPAVGIAPYSVYEYRGIPYALPPTGNRRWALPEPLATLGNGVFDASKFGPACPQQARFNLTEASVSEDCLSINVSTPAGTKPGDNLPVLFWIHGGAFIGGSSSLYRLDKLSGQGRLIVVSINYRIGVLGFMPNPAFQTTTSTGTFNGNYGLEDQRLAMKWVQDNIAAFGGDTTQVTIAGESAGAGSVCMHLTAPSQVSGLFKQAITQSAGCMALLPTVAEAQYNGPDKKLWKASATIQSALGCPVDSNTLSCMRSKTVEEILVQQGAYTASNIADLTPFSPVTGDVATVNTTVPSSFKTAATNGALLSVPMLMGGTKEELGLYVGYYWQGAQFKTNSPVDKTTIDSTWLPLFYPGPTSKPDYYSSQISSHAAYKAGLHSNDSNEVAKTFGQVLSDYNPNIGINNCLYLQTSNVVQQYAGSKPIYQFEFDDPAAPVCKVGISEPCPPYQLGSVHSSELNYLFPNLSNTAAINAPDLAPASQGLSNQLVAYWSQFVYSGQPNVSGLPAWPLYAGKQTASVMLLKPGASAPYDSDAAHQCTAFWSPLYSLKNSPPFP